MKHFFSFLIILLTTAMGADAQQIKLEIALPDSIAGKVYVQNLIRQAIKDLGQITPTNPELPKCKAGPVLGGIINISATYLNAQFHGDSVLAFSWQIKNQSGAVLRSGISKPVNSAPGITFDALTPSAYTLTIAGSSCTSESSTMAFNVPQPVVVIPKPADCKRGPTIKEIYSISSTGLRVLFDGDDVQILSLKIVSGSNTEMYFDTIKPSGNVLSIVFKNLLPAGKYKMVLTGVSCSGSNSMEFNVSKDTGEVITPDPVESRDFLASTIAKGMDDHLKISQIQTADGVLITDNSRPHVSEGNEIAYLIGSQILRSKEPLKSYLVAGKNPFRVLKYKPKVGTENTNHWSDGLRNGYYSPDACEIFSYNTSFAFNTFFVKGGNDSEGFLQHIPQSYDPSNKITSWADIAPDMHLPTGHVWISSPWEGDIDLVFRKGVTHIPHHDLPWTTDINRVVSLKNEGKTYNNVPRIETILGLVKKGENDYTNGWNRAWWPNGPLTDAEAYDKANRADVSDAVWIGETEENEAWMNNDAQMWGSFYPRLKERYEADFGKRGIPYYIVHNYYHLWKGNMSLTGSNSREYHKSLLTRPVEQLPVTVFSPGGVLSSTTMIVEGVYLGAPDIQISQPYELIFRLELIKHLGYDAGVFLAGVHEFRPNNPYEYIYPEGTFYAPNKIPLDPNLHIANGFLAQVYGKLFVEWGGSSKTARKTFDQQWNPGLWFPAGSSSPQGGFPHYQKPGDPVYYGFSGSSDLSYFSQKLYNDSFGQTDGGACQYLKFKIDNGPWITPVEGEVVDAYTDKRGLVYSQTLNGKTAWFYLNCYADNQSHALQVQLPSGRIVNQKVAGIGIHAKLERL